MTTVFEQKVYDKTLEIPSGMVTTYKEIARAIGNPWAYRAVGNALNRNPTPIKVPCHRVIRSDRHLGGFAFSSREKEKLLLQEGIKIENGKVKNKIFTLV